jgi:hypothetical protein
MDRYIQVQEMLDTFRRFADAVMSNFTPGIVEVGLPKKHGLVQGDLIGKVLDLPLEIEIRKEGPPLPRLIVERRRVINESGGLFVIAETPSEAVKQIERFLEARR